MIANRFFSALVGFFFLGCISTGGSTGSGGGSLGLAGGTVPPGDTGSTVESLLENPLSAICATPFGRYFMTSFAGNIITSQDGSALSVLEGEEFELNAVHCDQTATSSSMGIWFVGNDGLIKFYDGTTLADQTNESNRNLYGVYGKSLTEVYAVGAERETLYFDGSNWNEQDNSAPSNTLRGLSGRPALPEYIAVGDNGLVLQNGNTGTQGDWTVVEGLEGLLPSGTRLNDVWMDPNSLETFAVGNAGIFLHRKTDGTWERQNEGLTALELFAVHGTAANSVVAVGENLSIFGYDGSDWVQQTVNVEGNFNLYDVLLLSNAAYAVGGSGTTSSSTGIILQYTSNGWTAL